VDDEMEVIHADSSAEVATTNTPLLRGHDGIACLSHRDLTDFQFISVTKDGFVPVSLNPIDNRLNIIM
jgi:hypothetical protein